MTYLEAFALMKCSGEVSQMRALDIQIGSAHLGASTWRRSMPMTQKPKVASSLGMNFSGAMAVTSCKARPTSAEYTYLKVLGNRKGLKQHHLHGTHCIIPRKYAGCALAHANEV